FAVGELRRENAGGAGADEYANAFLPVPCARPEHRVAEVVLRKTGQRQPMIAAIEMRERGRQRSVFESGDPADPRVEAKRRLEIVAAQPARGGATRPADVRPPRVAR